MNELYEVGEMIADEMYYEEIQSQIEELSSNYEEALSGGFEDIAKTYKEKVKQLKEKIEKKDPPRTTETGHQGESGDLTFEGKLRAHQGYMEESAGKEDGAHQGGASKEISFGSSDLKRVEQKIKAAGSDIDMYTDHLNSDILFNRNTDKSMSDLKYAKKRYAEAIKEKERILKKG